MKIAGAFFSIKQGQILGQKACHSNWKLISRDRTAITFNGKTELICMNSRIGSATSRNLARKAKGFVQRTIKLALYSTKIGLNLKTVESRSKIFYFSKILRKEHKI